MNNQNKPAPTQIRDIKRLKSPFKEKLKSFLKHMKQNHEEMAAHETYRTAERQYWLRKNGKSWVKVSNHQLGLAADLHFVIFPHFPASKSERWKTAHRVAKQFGIDNGQDLWGTDGNHFQDDGKPLNNLQFPLGKGNEGGCIQKKQQIKTQMQTNSEIWHDCDQIINRIEKIKAKVNKMNKMWRKK